MDSWRALIDRFGIGPFSEAIGVSYGAAKKMRLRNSVQPKYWPKLVNACYARGWPVSTEMFTGLAVSRAEESEPTDKEREPALSVPQ